MGFFNNKKKSKLNLERMNNSVHYPGPKPCLKPSFAVVSVATTLFPWNCCLLEVVVMLRHTPLYEHTSWKTLSESLLLRWHPLHVSVEKSFSCETVSKQNTSSNSSKKLKKEKKNKMQFSIQLFLTNAILSWTQRERNS